MCKSLIYNELRRTVNQKQGRGYYGERKGLWGEDKRSTERRAPSGVREVAGVLSLWAKRVGV